MASCRRRECCTYNCASVRLACVHITTHIYLSYRKYIYVVIATITQNIHIHTRDSERFYDTWFEHLAVAPLR